MTRNLYWNGDTAKEVINICPLGRLSHLLEESPYSSHPLHLIELLDSLNDVCLIVVVPDVEMKAVATLVLNVATTKR